jgi:Tfp pilus assembly protein FimT
MLEMMVGLVIVGITGAITVGKIQQLMVQNRIQRAATVLRNDLEAAFAIAARNRRPIDITWNSTTQQMSLTGRSGTSYRRTNLTIGQFGLRSQDVVFSRSPVEVYPDGLANDTLTITISRGSNMKLIRMSRAGLVLVQ